MNDLLTKAKIILFPYRWLIFLFATFLIFVLGAVLVSTQLTPPDSGNGKTIPQVTQTSPSSQQPDVSETPIEESTQGSEFEINFETQPGFQKKETLSDGSIAYFFKSENNNRPDMIMVKNGDQIFSRRLSSQTLPLSSISVYKEVYGEPEKLVNGTKTYGAQSATYIYASSGLAIIVDKNSSKALEEQVFTATTVDDYLQKFGSQN